MNLMIHYNAVYLSQVLQMKRKLLTVNLVCPISAFSLLYRHLPLLTYFLSSLPLWTRSLLHLLQHSQ